MTAPTYSKTRPAARFVERHAVDETDEQWLKEVLGLTRPDGSLAPDDTHVYTFSSDHAGKAPGAKPVDGTRTKPARDRSAVPPGLANLAPETAEEAPKKRRGPKPQPKVIRPRKERQVPECGTYKAFSRHKRRIKLGQDDPSTLDDACLEAGRAWARDYQNDRNARIRKERERQRLIEAGVQTESVIETLSELAR